jgi:hypothetical protein
MDGENFATKIWRDKKLARQKTCATKFLRHIFVALKTIQEKQSSSETPGKQKTRKITSPENKRSGGNSKQAERQKRKK